MEKKTCTNCKEEKELSEFHKGIGKLGRRSQCKVCCKLLYDTPERLKKNKERRAQKRKNDPEYRKREAELAKQWNHNHPVKYLLRAAKQRAKDRNLIFSITEKDLILPTICPLLEIPLQMHREERQDNSYSIDRIDSSKGYIPGNVWIISARANIIKNNATLEELKLLTKNFKKLCKNN